MAAVWGRLRGASSSELLRVPSTRNRSRRHQREDEYYANYQKNALDKKKVYWQDTFDRRLDALGISQEAPRYELRRGGQIHLKPADDDNDFQIPQSGHKIASTSPAISISPPPPRNPLRRLASSPEVRPTSSIYDDDLSAASPSAVPSPLQIGSSGKMDSRATALQISPPSSPDIDSPARKPIAGDVSPIEDEFELSQGGVKWPPGSKTTDMASTIPKSHASPPRSNIPTMRRERRKNQEAAMHSRRESRLRDITNASSSKTTQHFIPQSDAQRWNREGTPVHGSHANYASSPNSRRNSEMGTTVTISAGPTHTSRNGPRNTPSPSFGDRVRHMGINKKPEPINERPAWNGASGRTALLQPVRDDLNAAPLQAPTNREGRGRGKSGINNATSPPHHPGPSETPDRSGATVRQVASPISMESPAQSSNQQQPRQTAHSPQDGAQSYPSPPYSGSPMRMSPETTQPTQSPNTIGMGNLPAPPMVIPDTEKAIKRKPPPSSAHLNSSSRPNSALLTDSNKTQNTVAEAYIQPPSRFSISTHATSNPGSPRISDEENRPPLPEPATSMMDRSRPRYPDDSSDKMDATPIILSMKHHAKAEPKAAEVTKRKAPPQRRNIEPRDRPESILSLSKALPPAPPELSSAHDRVGNLNARLDGLAHRRQNINLSIKQMTELMPSDNLMASKEVLAKRELERKKVEGLRQELAEVKQEEYDLGLKLHRAYKRLDREAEFEPTGLWVRRVTT